MLERLRQCYSHSGTLPTLVLLAQGAPAGGPEPGPFTLRWTVIGVGVLLVLIAGAFVLRRLR